MISLTCTSIIASAFMLHVAVQIFSKSLGKPFGLLFFLKYHLRSTQNPSNLLYGQTAKGQLQLSFEKPHHLANIYSVSVLAQISSMIASGKLYQLPVYQIWSKKEVTDIFCDLVGPMK